MRATALLPIALALVGCGNAPTAQQQAAISDTATVMVKEGAAAVRAGLIDPGSADFGPVTYNADTNKVCGSVNAKNGSGKYTGKSAFWYDPKTQEVFKVAHNQDHADMVSDAKRFVKNGCPSGLEAVLKG